MATIIKAPFRGGEAMDVASEVPAGKYYQLVSVSLALSAAPTTSENFTVTLDAEAGSDYDVLLYTLDLSASSVTDLVWQPDVAVYLEPGDALDCAYDNTDNATWGLQVTWREVY